MRKITTMLLAVLFCSTAFAQVTLPDNAVVKDYAIKFKKSSFVEAIMATRIAFTDNKAYLDVESKNVWVEGDWDGRQIRFASKQPLGNTNFRFFMAATFEATDIVDGENKQTSYKFTAIDSLVLKLDETGTKFVTDDNVGMVISEAKDVSPLNVVDKFIQPSWIVVDDVAAIPQDPVINKCDAYNESWGYGWLNFTMPAFDVKGNLLKFSNYYYNLYFDDDPNPYEFTTDVYKRIDENMTNVPYDFDDDDDFNYIFTGVHGVAFYIADLDRIGVQSVYMGGGEENRSNIVWYEFTPAGITTAETAAPAKEVYYDITGKRVSQPQNGLYIKQTINADGSKKAVKVMK